MTTFTIVNDDTLCDAIEQCQQQLVYVAPGITRPVVEAMQQQLARSLSLQVTLIVDIDPEVYRLGYGTMEGLQALQALVKESHLELRKQAGLRIGLLICDGRTLVYSPTPLLIEAGSTSQDKPNAVWVGQDMPKSLSKACNPDAEGEIGLQAAIPVEVEQALQSLRNEPPKKFDIARVERVYHSKIQFVELEVTGYRLSSKKITIPNDLLVGDDKALNEKLKNSFQLLAGGSAPKVHISTFDPETAEPCVTLDGKILTEEWDETALESARKKLYEDFLINVPRFGWVIMCRQLQSFESRLACFKAQVAAYREAVEKSMGQSLEKAIAELVDVLLPRIKEQLPKRLTKFMHVEPSDDDIRSVLVQELNGVVGGVSGVFAPEVRCIYKAVTYESIKDEKFLKSMKESMRKSGAGAQAGLLFSECDAAMEV
ncbi:hypothetical protein SBP02_18470 [Pseudomonas benzenivorans]|uniref:Uncharacterized protein n=1 Tax=Pseudomonas benzenivorans TaxID=556533 RepID=A0ABZ0PVN9_9PSED|nr:hypothetical protein [Pseudomonas benzenivorans]WPC04717.1 hypothetical protein SBP02_18470 [Pseudomonas benzenivorans]